MDSLPPEFEAPAARAGGDFSDIAQLKVPPHSLEAEQSVLGGLMIANDAWDRVADMVSDADFYRPEHRLIFRRMAQR